MKISIVLEALTGSFETDMDRAAKAAERRTKAIQRQVGQVARAVAAVTASAVAGLTYLSKQAINTADDMSKLSQSTGVSTETLSQLAYTAGLSGTGMDDLAKSLGRLSKNAADASNGLQTPIRAFEQLGIEFRNTDGTLRSTDDLLLDVADKFSTMADGTEKSALAMELLGRSGTSLIPLLNQGSAGIKAMNQEADKLGLTVSTLAGKQAEQFNDSLTRLGFAQKGFVNQLTTGMLPALDALSRGFTGSLIEKMDQSKAAIVDWGDTFGDILVFTADAVTTTLTLISKTFESFGRGFVGGGFAIWVAQLRGDYAQSIRLLEEMKAEQVDIWGELANDSNFRRYRDALDSVRREMEAMEGLDFVSVGARSRQPLLGLAQGAEEIDDYSKSLEAFGRRFQTAEQAAKELSDELDRFRAGLTDGQIQNAEAEIFDTLTSGLEEITVSIDKRVSEPYKKAIDEMSEYTVQAKRNMQTSLADFLFDPFDDGLKGMLRSFADTLRRMLAEMAAADIFGLLGGGGGSGLFDFVGGLFGGGRASGGPVTAGTTYLVGERGPEYFTPRVSGAIVPQGAGNVVINQNVNIEGSNIGPDQMVRILDDNNKKLKGEFLQEIRRGTYS